MTAFKLIKSEITIVISITHPPNDHENDYEIYLLDLFEGTKALSPRFILFLGLAVFALSGSFVV